MEKMSKTQISLRHEVARAEACAAGAGFRLPPEAQRRRVAAAMQGALSAIERETVCQVAAGSSLAEIARASGKARSTVCRNFHRGVKRLREALRY